MRNTAKDTSAHDQEEPVGAGTTDGIEPGTSASKTDPKDRSETRQQSELLHQFRQDGLRKGPG